MRELELTLIKGGKEMLKINRSIVIVRLKDHGEYGVMYNHIPFTAELAATSSLRDDRGVIAEVTGNAIASFYMNKLLILDE